MERTVQTPQTASDQLAPVPARRGVVVAGEALIDLIQRPDGSLLPHLGGSPWNLARALGRLGCAVSYLNPLSTDDFGMKLFAALQDSRVECSGGRSRLPTSLAVVKVDAQGHPDYAFYREGVADRDFAPSDLLAHWPDEAALFHVGSLAVMPPDGHAWLATLSALVARGVSTSIDINMRPRVASDGAAYARLSRQILAQGGDWIDVRGVRKHVQAYLKDFLFDPGLVDTKIGILSGGERSRLLLAREFARTANLLVLDEPTNDLDLETLDLLQEVIADFEGTVLIVSHDRDFLDRTVTITLGLDGSGKVDIVAGGYADWEARRKTPPSGGKGGSSGGLARTNPAPEGGLKPLPTKPAAAPRLSYKDQRDYEILPGRIEELEAAIARGEALLADPDLYARDPQRFATISQGIANARAEKDAAEERWLMLAEMVEG